MSRPRCEVYRGTAICFKSWAAGSRKTRKFGGSDGKRPQDVSGFGSPDVASLVCGKGVWHPCLLDAGQQFAQAPWNIPLKIFIILHRFPVLTLVD